MPNRLIFSVRYANRVFLKLLKVMLSMVLLMALLRINIYFLSVHFKISGIEMVDVTQSILDGLRFDAMVMAFVLAPVSLLLFLQGLLEWWPRLNSFLLRFYMGVFWFAYCALSWFDFSIFTNSGKRVSAEQLKSVNVDAVLNTIATTPSKHEVIFSIVILMLMGFIFFMLKELRFGFWKDEYSPSRGNAIELILRLFWPLVFLALFIVTGPSSHDFGANLLSQMSLNPLWEISH